MSAAATLLRPLVPSFDAAVERLRAELLAAGKEHNASAYAILQITTPSSAYLAGAVGHPDDVGRALRAIVRQGGAFSLVERSGPIEADDFAIAA